MKIFFEEYNYPSAFAEPYIDKAYLSYLKDDRVSIPFVGYFYSSNTDKDKEDTVFILPKVFINVVETDKGKKELAFGEFDPLAIFDTTKKDNPLFKSQSFDYSFVFDLSTWIYRAISRFKKRNPETTIVTQEKMRDVNDVRGYVSETLIDIILRLIRFNNEHRNLFTYIAKINSQGYNKINWRKTMGSVTPVLQDRAPVYLTFKNKTKVINFDEDLIVLFYSVLDYLHMKFNFKIPHDINYPTDARGVEKLITSGKGTRLLKSIRKKYFKDELVELWNLLYVFFTKAQMVSSKGTHQEYLIVRDFNIVFEDMIDSIISDNTKEKHEELKDQPDGKIVDHIYRYDSLIKTNDKNNDIYYIGDSKYYKQSNKPGENSNFKQFTYVRNVIQMNMEIWKPSDKEITRWNYYDERTEGYNITPNFFIRGKVTPERIDYSDPQLELWKDNNGKDIVERKLHHHNRIFDRDTLFVLKYDINFLYVLSSYALNHSDDGYNRQIHKLFRQNLLKWLANNYRFLMLTPKLKKKEKAEDVLERHFHKLLGKVYSYGECQFILGLDLGKNESNVEEQLHRWEEDYDVWKSLEDDFRIEIFDIENSTINGVYEGEKLNAVVDDQDLAQELNKQKIFDVKNIDMLPPIIDKYTKKYFGMSQHDWRKIFDDYFILKPKAVITTLPSNDEELSLAANNREASFDRHKG